MKKSIFTLLIFLSSYFIVQAQRYQTTTGSAMPDETWAVVEDPALNAFVAIGNATINGASNVWITSYAANGTLLTSSVANAGRPIIARDISIAPVDQLSGQPTYYVTGWTQFNFNGGLVNQIFVGRMFLNGAFLWYQENPLGGQGNDKEGVAVVTAPNGDVVVAGHVFWPPTLMPPLIPPGQRIIMSRLNPFGAILWSNVYNQPGFWTVRELDLGVPAPGCIPSPAGMPGEFVITGEVIVPPGQGGAGVPQTFAAVYNGAGFECWRNIYPAATGIVNTTGDAGYDVVYDPLTGNYQIAGVAQMGPGRGVVTSTPYMLGINPAGVLMGSAVYVGLGNIPLGIYPRCISLTPNPGAMVFSGPDFVNNQVFFGTMPTILGAAPPMQINSFIGNGTANFLPQPFFLQEAQPEDIIVSNIGTIPGYIISTNAFPVGAFGAGDSHLISTNAAGQTPNACAYTTQAGHPLNSNAQLPSASTPTALLVWGAQNLINMPHIVQQVSCVDPCIVSASFTATVVGNTVTFNNTSAGNGTLTYSWNFGDGSPISTATNPIHVYAGAGPYIACLTVTNTNASGITCTSTFCQTFTFCNVLANFTFTLNCKTATFRNTTTGTGPFTYAWLFPDGSTATTTNTTKTFATCGNYVVRLIACNANCCDTILKTVNIACCTAAVDFCLAADGRSVTLINNTTVNPIVGTTYTVYLNGLAIGWTNNTAKILVAGSNTICVKARRIICGDTCCANCCKTIFVSDQCTLAANFWHQIQSNSPALGQVNVAFTNKTTPNGFTSVWNFGDPASGAANTSTLLSPTHIYAPGTYTACLIATRLNGADTCQEKVCRSIIIEAPCNVQSKFKTKYCIATPLVVDFTNQSIGAITYEWNFGDGTASTVTNPSHTYAAAGTYIVCLKAIVNGNCWSRACYQVRVSTTSCNTSCTTLPGAPAFFIPNSESAGEGVQENEMELLSTEKYDGELKEELLSNSSLYDLQNELKVFPNPADNELNIQVITNSDATGEIIIHTAKGEIVYQTTQRFYAGQPQIMLPTTALADGLYHISVLIDGAVLTKHFAIVKH